MKKLTALLLAMLMLALPVFGSAATTTDLRKTAQSEGRPLTSIVTFEPADLSAMLGEEANTLYSDILNALALKVYTNGIVSDQIGLDVLLQEESVFNVDLAVGEDGTFYLNNNFLGTGSIAVAPDEWQPLLEKLVDLMAAANGMSAEEVAETKAQIASMFSGEMVTAANAFADVSFDNVIAKATEIASKAQTTAVTEQPEGSDHAVSMVTISMTADDVMAIYTEIANSIRASESAMAYLTSMTDGEMTADEMLDQLLAGIKEMITMVDGDVPMTMYMNAQGELVQASMDMTMKAEEQNVVKFAYAYNRLTTEQGLSHTLSMQGYQNDYHILDAGVTYLDAGEAGLVTAKMLFDFESDKALIAADAVFDDNNLDATMKFEVTENNEQTVVMDVAALYKNADNKSNTEVTLTATSEDETVGFALTANNEDVPGDKEASAKGDLTLSVTAEGMTVGLKFDYTDEATSAADYTSTAAYNVSIEAMGVELPLLTAHVFTSSAFETEESVAAGEAVRPATMTDDELTAYGTQIAQTAQLELIELMQQLPASVLQLMMSE